MSRTNTATWAPDRLRAGPWRGDASVAYVAPVPGEIPPDSAIRRCLDRLEHQGYRRILTAALTVGEQRPFVDAGFQVCERLHLLRHDLLDLPTASHPERSRRGRSRDHPTILDIDGRAFDPFWRLDAAGFHDALRATPVTRLRVVDRGGVLGYAITGRGGPVGYLQRLAVDPGHQGAGIGTALVIDSLRWARKRGAAAVMVNTQERNAAALRLYERLGFVRQRFGLAVLERDLDVDQPAPAPGLAT